MIEALQYMVTFCFWLFLALVFGSLCVLGIWTLVTAVRYWKEKK